MSAVSVLLSPRDEALGERIATALSRGGHDVRVVSGDHGDLGLNDDLGGDASIVVWSNAAMKLAFLHEQAREALTKGSLIPVAVGGAGAPEGFEKVQPVDLSGWKGDDGDPRWRFVLEEINIATERRRLVDQDIWVTAQRDAIEEAAAAAPQETVSIDAAPAEGFVDAEFEDAQTAAQETQPALTARPIGAAEEPLVIPTARRAPQKRRRRRKFRPGAVAVVGVMSLCVMTGAAIIFAPTIEPAAGPELRPAPSIDLAMVQPVEGADAPSDKAAATEDQPPAAVSDNSILEEESAPEAADAVQDEMRLALGPSTPEETTEPGAGDEGAAEAPASIDSLLASVPELSNQSEEVSSVQEQSEVSGDFFKDCSVCPDMAALSGGAFTMGAGASEGSRPDEAPATPVMISDRFAIATREVTFKQWDACVADGGCNGYKPADFGWGRGDQPVVGISHKDALAYTSWLSSKTGVAYRLPTEAEWEFAARAGAETAFAFGNTLSPQNANYDRRYPYGGAKGTPLRRPTKASTFAPNAFGLFDMHGNVWEWTADCWKAGHAGRPSNGSAVSIDACGSRVLKGGAFNTGGWRLRAAHRIGKPAGAREQEFGFRVARTLD